jgi:hypothetical protein
VWAAVAKEERTYRLTKEQADFRASEPNRAFAPPFQLIPMTDPILQRPEGIRRKEIAAQMTVTKAAA